MAEELAQGEAREPFEVDASSFDFLDVTAESGTPQEGSSPLESVVETDVVEGEEGEKAPESESSTVEEEKPEEETEEAEKVEKEVEKADAELLVEKDGKTYDFSTAPKEMREVIKTNNKLVNAFVRDRIEDVQAELRNLSPTSYSKLEQTIVQSSAEANADKWADFLVKVKPDVVVESLLGSDLKDVNLDVLKEIALLYQEESDEGDELRTILELRNPDFATVPRPKLEPAEKQELERLRAEEKQRKDSTSSADVQKVTEEVFDYVDDTIIVPIVQQFGLMPDKDDEPETAEAKKDIVNSLASIIDSRLSSNAETKSDYEALWKKINAGDKAGAMALLPSLMGEIEAIAISRLGFIKNQQTTSLKQKHTPAKTPPKALASGASVQQPPKPLTLAERLETQSDEELLRNMGIA